MTYEALFAILSCVKILDRKFEITPVVISDSESTYTAWFIQVTYLENDINTGEPMIQKSREWLIKPTMSESDVVRTAYAAVTRSYAHVVSEHFTYKGKRIYGPHIEIDAMLAIAEHVR